MNAVEWVKLLINSPGLPALVTAGVAILAGRHLIDAKDQRIAGLQETHAVTLKALQDAHAEALRAKDDRIELLERRSPAKLQEDFEAMTALLQSRSTQLQEQLAATRSAMEEDQRLSAAQRAILEERLSSREEELNGVRGALEAARTASANLDTVARQAGLSRIHEVMELGQRTITRALSPRYTRLDVPSVGGKGFSPYGVFEATGIGPDIVSELVLSRSAQVVADGLSSIISNLVDVCREYREPRNRPTIGLLTFVLVADGRHTDVSTYRGLELLTGNFDKLSRVGDVPLLLLDLTEDALRHRDVGELQERLWPMLDKISVP